MKERVNPFAFNALCSILGHRKSVLSRSDFAILHLRQGAQCLSGRVLDSRPKGRGFEPHQRHCVVVLEHDTFFLAKYWFKPGRPVPI